jgi:serine/threonine-protein kinase
VVGRSQDAALAALTQAGLTATVRGVNANAERGTVVEQSPAAGESMARGGTVAISVGSGQVVVPNVEGQREADAIRRLTDAGLRIDSVRQRDNDDVPRGMVIQTDPEKGRVVPRGSQVDLVVSTGE